MATALIGFSSNFLMIPALYVAWRQVECKLAPPLPRNMFVDGCCAGGPRPHHLAPRKATQSCRKHTSIHKVGQIAELPSPLWGSCFFDWAVGQGQECVDNNRPPPNNLLEFDSWGFLWY